MKTRIYIVEKTNPALDERPALVRAVSPAAALRHAAQDTFSVRVAGQDDLVQALSQGVAVVDAGEGDAK